VKDESVMHPYVLRLTALVLGALLLGGCAGRTWQCESPCWPGPRLGPIDPCLCREPRLEGPCPEQPEEPPCAIPTGP
jgi:hypothetical protein